MAKKKQAPPPDFTQESAEDVAAELAKRFERWRPAREELTTVLAVPTIFPQYDRATRVKGHPIQRVTLVHGPSSHGKTVFCQGLAASFLERGHFAGWVDAEMTTPIDWCEKLMTTRYANTARFLAIRPETYEQTVDAVLEFAQEIARLREEKLVVNETTGLVVVDSLKKLVPKNLFAKIMEEGASEAKGSIDGMGGRAAQIKAALNGAWLDQQIPVLNRTKTALTIIARESEDTLADQRDKQMGNDWKVTGGKAPFYDSSLVIRVTAREIWEGGDGTTRGTMVGTRHCGTIYKTKVAAKDSEHARFYFHTSNGVLVPEGFDRARDVMEMAKGYGITSQSGSWTSWRGERWNGNVAFHAALHEKSDMLAAMESECRERFNPNEKLDDPEHDIDGVLAEVFE